MGYKIVENAFAPKIEENWQRFNKINSHAIVVNYCNFNCSFCGVDYAPKEQYIDYSLEQFENVVCKLIKKGKCFKFSGGEPTLNSRLCEDLQVVKRRGGYIYLDTNGSCFETIKNLIDLELVDVLGVSLKGLDEEEAMRNSGGKIGKELCWDNVLATIEYASYSQTKVVVTYVCFNDFNLGNVYKFAELFEKKDVYLKLNNFHVNPHSVVVPIEPIKENEIENCVRSFLIEKPQWRERMIIIDGEKGIRNFSDIKFL